jgi:hypothetical protein
VISNKYSIKKTRRNLPGFPTYTKVNAIVESQTTCKPFKCCFIDAIMCLVVERTVDVR